MPGSQTDQPARRIAHGQRKQLAGLLLVMMPPGHGPGVRQKRDFGRKRVPGIGQLLEVGQRIDALDVQSLLGFDHQYARSRKSPLATTRSAAPRNAVRGLVAAQRGKAHGVWPTAQLASPVEGTSQLWDTAGVKANRDLPGGEQKRPWPPPRGL